MQEPFYREWFLFYFPQPGLSSLEEWIYVSIARDFLELIPQKIDLKAGKNWHCFRIIFYRERRFLPTLFIFFIESQHHWKDSVQKRAVFRKRYSLIFSYNFFYE